MKETPMTDNRCAEPDYDRRANRYDLPRALRLALADIREDDSAVEILYDEIGDCPHCWRGISRVLAGAVIGMGLSQANDDKELVEAQLEKQLAAALDGQ
ncbi:hypothetical protein A5779_12800 [Mycolicibacterium peregrinum]|uniref:Uncharacterized protein n=2 Tax=Mycolicibacterium peregrinum TaxID=43304 RepID=A0A1A0V7R3_MYCPR|nr:hypothetical protein A5779_12800 [Mycolicibacterium peregrinum]